MEILLTYLVTQAKLQTLLFLELGVIKIVMQKEKMVK